MNTYNIEMPLLVASQAQKEVTHNEALLILDALTQLSVISKVITTPPLGALNGDRYIVPTGATGDWAGHEEEIAYALDGGWRFITPKNGFKAYVEDENDDYLYDMGWIRIVNQIQSYLRTITINNLNQHDSIVIVPSPAVTIQPERGVVLAFMSNPPAGLVVSGYRNPTTGEAEIIAYNSTNNAFSATIDLKIFSA